MHQPLERRATMRKVLISLAAAAATLAIAAPASAQPHGNMTPYGAPAYGYGYNNNYGQVRSLQVRIDAVQRQINMLDQRNILSNREAKRLRQESRQVERTLRRAAQYGLTRYEARNIQLGIFQLERDVQREARDRNGRWNRRY
jgi:TolA-binding protein